MSLPRKRLIVDTGAVTLQLQAAKECPCERSEAIPRLWGLLRRFTPRNDKSMPLLTGRYPVPRS